MDINSKDVALYFAPRACSRVTLMALEEAQVDFVVHPVNMDAGEHREKTYLAVNPMGKIPALRMNGVIYTENAAILYLLNSLYPNGRLLPIADERIGHNQGLQDLVWCASTLHPMTRQVRKPGAFTSGDADSVRTDGVAKYQPVLKLLAERLSNGAWWYGGDWSIVDTYLFWNYSTAAAGGLSLSEHPEILDHARRVRARPSFQRVLDEERIAYESFGVVPVAEAI